MSHFIQVPVAVPSSNSPPIGSSSQSTCVSRLVALTLEKIMGENFHRHLQASPVMSNDPFVKFQSSYAPDVSVEYYIQRIFKHSKCSDSCLIIMLVYIDRLIENKGLVLSTLNAHRIIITSLMVAAKYHDDLFYNNAYFAKLGGIPLPELNMLEVDFLLLQNFSMFVDTSLFEKYQTQLQNYKVYVQMQYSPRTTAMHPIGSPYSHQCENAFQFSPHRMVQEQMQQQQQQMHANNGYFVTQQPHQLQPQLSSSPPLLDFAIASVMSNAATTPAFLFPACSGSYNTHSTTSSAAVFFDPQAHMQHHHQQQQANAHFQHQHHQQQQSLFDSHHNYLSRTNSLDQHAFATVTAHQPPQQQQSASSLSTSLSSTLIMESIFACPSMLMSSLNQQQQPQPQYVQHATSLCWPNTQPQPQYFTTATNATPSTSNNNNNSNGGNVMMLVAPVPNNQQYNSNTLGSNSNNVSGSNGYSLFASSNNNNANSSSSTSNHITSSFVPSVTSSFHITAAAAAANAAAYSHNNNHNHTAISYNNNASNNNNHNHYYSSTNSSSSSNNHSNNNHNSNMSQLSLLSHHMPHHPHIASSHPVLFAVSHPLLAVGF